MRKASREKPPANDTPPLAIAIRDALTPGRGRPLAVTVTTIAQAVRFASAICLPSKSQAGDAGEEGAGKPSKVETLIDKRSLSAAAFEDLSAADQADARVVASRQKLLIATRMLGSHGGKVPDARLGPGATLPDRTVTVATDGIAGVHTGSVALTHSISGAGSAGLNAHMRFLCMSLVVEGQPPTSLAAVLAGESAERDALLAACSDEAATALAEVGAAVERRLLKGEGVPRSVPPQRAQVLFPIEGGDYVAISPLYSYTLGAELHARQQARVWAEAEEDRQIISMRVAHVGGTKPWNAGLLATYISGRFPRLLGLPQRDMATGGAAAVRRFLSRGLPVASSDIPFPLVASFLAAFSAHEARPNVQTKAAAFEAACRLCDAALGNLTAVMEANDASLAVSGAYLAPLSDKLPAGSLEMAKLLGIGGAVPDSDDVAQAAGAVAKKVEARLHGRRPKAGSEPFVVDGAVHAFIVDAARRRLESII